jgi:hypothetical protein
MISPGFIETSGAKGMIADISRGSGISEDAARQRIMDMLEAFPSAGPWACGCFFVAAPAESSATRKQWSGYAAARISSRLNGRTSKFGWLQAPATNAIIKVTGQGSIVRTIASRNLRCGIQMGKILAA